jgi:2'-5' RNA ligase
MPRLFVAVTLPADVAGRLEDISGGLNGAAWTPSHQYHVTLRFLGEVDESRCEDIRHALHDVRCESFYMDLKGVGHFPHRGHPETLWAGIEATEPLEKLRRRVESALGKAGLPSDGRKFVPHVTLARLKNGASQYLGLYEIEHSLFSVRGVPVQEFHLYSSRLTPDGAVHTVEESYGLEGLLEGE